MNVSISDNDSGTIEAVIDGITGLEVQVNVKAEFEPGQTYQSPRYSRGDYFGQEGFPATFEITETKVYYGEINGVETFGKIELDSAQEAEIIAGLLTAMEED